MLKNLEVEMSYKRGQTLFIGEVISNPNIRLDLKDLQ